MVAASELRIGNWVELNGAFGKVQSVDEFNQIKVFGYYPITPVKPIPLSEEILFKCGFSKGSVWNVGKYLCKEINYGFWITYKKEKIILDFISAASITEIEYLHQLQNLYFALTGKELEIEL